MRRIVILWEDAECDAFKCVAEIPEAMDLAKEREEWNRWYTEEYVPGIQPLKENSDKVEYHSLWDQLSAHGAKPVQMETFVI